MTAQKVAALIHPESVCLNLTARSKAHALHEVAGLLNGCPSVPDLGAFLREILAREQEGNTAIGHGVAIPHARTDQCREIVIAVGRSMDGIDYGAADGKPVQILFLIGTPMQDVTEYLRVVGMLARLLARVSIRQRLLDAADSKAFLTVIAEADQQQTSRMRDPLS